MLAISERRIVENWWVQGRSESNRELLDAAALCRQLVPEGSVEAFLADHRHDLFPDEMFEDLFPSSVVDPRSRPTWWPRSWSSRPSKDSRIATRLGR